MSKKTVFFHSFSRRINKGRSEAVNDGIVLFSGLFTISSVVTPVYTSRVFRPPWLPNRISVDSLSPTITVLVRSIPRVWTIKSKNSWFGLPTTVGCILAQVCNMATIVPPPGSSRPPSTGSVSSVFVATNKQPGFDCKCLRAKLEEIERKKNDF